MDLADGLIPNLCAGTNHLIMFLLMTEIIFITLLGLI